MDKVRVSVIGATGYAGEQLINILIDHPALDIVYLADQVDKPVNVSDIFPAFADRLDASIEPFSPEKTDNSDVIFLPLPHRVSFKFVPKLMKPGKKVIDISADYRIKDLSVYKKYYETTHGDPGNVEKAVYGLVELYREDIKNAQLIANPGCYPTASILGLTPLVKNGLTENIIIDAKSGISGAGRNSGIDADKTGDLYVYKLFGHQHLPEIEQELSLQAGKETKILFTPHIIPAQRGIHATIYADLKESASQNDIVKLYKDMYNNEPFVKIIDNGTPHMKDVVGTNCCHISINVNGNKAIVISCIDNLLKGAASQAVQNMNIMMNLDETTGLTNIREITPILECGGRG